MATSGLGDRLAARLRHDGEARDVRQLALVGRHAERRVALEMLDRDEAFLAGQHDVLRSDVVLEIDEGLAFRPLDMPEGGEAGTAVRCLRRRRRGGGEAGRRGRQRALAPPSRQAVRQGVVPRRGAGDESCPAAARGRTAADLLVPHRAAAEMAGRWTSGDKPPDMARPSTSMRSLRAAVMTSMAAQRATVGLPTTSPPMHRANAAPLRAALDERRREPSRVHRPARRSSTPASTAIEGRRPAVVAAREERHAARARRQNG